MSIHTRLRELGLQLPHAAAPVASYQPVVVDGHTAYVSGQLPFVDGKLVTGKLGDTVTLEQPKVANGASDLMAEVFGEAGKHARSAVGVPVLPLNAAVEVDAIVALKA